MILKLLLNTEMIWMIFIKILKHTIQIKNAKYCLGYRKITEGKKIQRMQAQKPEE